jgi:transposase
MDHIGIDIGGKESQICVRNAGGQILEEKRIKTQSLGAYLSKKTAARVVLETCAEAFSIADEALLSGHQVRVVPATLVRSLGVGARGVKTDTRDARVLSEVSCRIELPSVHIPAEAARRRKSLCGMREGLVKSRTLLINTVKGYLRTVGRPLGQKGGAEGVASKVRKMWQKETKLGQMPQYLRRQLDTIEQLNEHIEEANKELGKEAKQDPICKRLMTVPGVGPVTSLRFVAALDGVERFGGARQVESYLGLVPGENSSSERKRRTGITKAGSPQVRWALVQAAWSARRCRPKDPMVQWALEIEKRRGRKVATIALARKMAGILYAMWRDGSEYITRPEGWRELPGKQSEGGAAKAKEPAMVADSEQ